MATFIGLLRGINVGGRNKIKMAELKERLAKVGLNEVPDQTDERVFRKKPQSHGDDPQLEDDHQVA